MSCQVPAKWDMRTSGTQKRLREVCWTFMLQSSVETKDGTHSQLLEEHTDYHGRIAVILIRSLYFLYTSLMRLGSS